MNDFFNRLDTIAEAKERDAMAKEAMQRAYTEQAVIFAEKLAVVLADYITEFEKRGYRCRQRKGNLPYYGLEVSKGGHSVELTIVNSQAMACGYELAVFYNNERHYVAKQPHLTQGFDKNNVEQFLQEVFQYFFK